MSIEPKIIHIEDTEDWRNEVRDYIFQYENLNVYKFISVTSIEEANNDLKYYSDPVIIIIDLRLGTHKNPNFQGLHWLLEELEGFIRRNICTAVFVISGQLNEGICDILVRRGIHKSHIYDKEKWPQERDFFIERLSESISDLKKKALSNCIDTSLYKSDLIVRNQVFISYSHKDTKWLKRIKVHLKPLERLTSINFWDDTMISPGTKWQEEISRAVASAKVAVFLVSADFLASDFISTNELPLLLAAAKSEGATILQVIVSPCRLPTSLAQFQAVNSPTRPLVRMSQGAQEDTFVKLTIAIENVLRV